MAMPFNIRFKLSSMMFLQYAIWGAWAVVGGAYFEKMGYSDFETSQLYGLLYLACIIAPFIGGQIADRYFPTQYFLAAVHLAGGVLLLLMAHEQPFLSMFIFMTIYSVLYAPTLALTNSLAFHQMKDANREFGGIRVWGSLGWIVVGVGLTLWRHVSAPEFSSQLGTFEFTGAWFGKFWDLWWTGPEAGLMGDLFFVAGGASIVLGLFSLILPHTPPKKTGVNPWAFLEALKLLKDKNFLIFMLIAFVVSTELQFYYIPTSLFLRDIGIRENNVPAVSTIAQLAEIFAMWLLLPLALRKIGVRWTLALGVIAWPLRYVVFALAPHLPWPVVVASLAFHGFGYAFFFIASQIYVNNVAHSDIRASAQSLLTLVTLGLGNYLGTVFEGVIKTAFTTTTAAVGAAPAVITTDWTTFFLIPCGLTTTCAIAYLVFFKPPEKQLAAEG
jgi:nucleoside transporter